MKILFLTEHLDIHSGWGRHSTDLIHTLQKQGHVVLVLCSEANETFSTIPQYSVLPPALSSRRTYFFSGWYAALGERTLKEHGFVPDIVHAIAEPYAPIAAGIAKKASRPYVLTMHGSFAVRPFLSAWYRLIATKIYIQAATIICISHYTETQVRKYVPTAPTVVIPNGVAMQNFPWVSFAQKKPLILSVGAIKDRKGYRELLQAFALVHKTMKDVQLVIVGNHSNTALVQELHAYSTEHQLQKVVTFKQKISDAELASLYDEAKVFALTPVSTPRSFEGFGLVYLEANAHGVPVIGSYDSGGEDAIRNEETGFLVHPHNSTEVAEKIITLLQLPEEKYEAMSRECIKHAHAYSWDTIVREYENIYSAV